MEKVKIKEIFNANAKTINLAKCDFINYLDTSSIVANHIDGVQKIDTKKDKVPSRAKRLIEPNTIVYSAVRPNLKHYGIIENPLENMVASTGFITLNIKDSTKHDINYMYYNLTQDKYTDYLHTIACNSVSSYPSINPSDLENLEICIDLNLNSQRKIAAVLKAIDDKIALNDKINALLERLARAVYDYYFVQFDFKDERGKPYKSSGGAMIFNPTLNRPIPATFEVLFLKDRLAFERGEEYGTAAYIEGKQDKNCIKFYRVGDMDDLGNTYINQTLFECPKVSENDLLVSFDGSVGRIAYALNGTFSSGIRKIYDKKGILNSATLYFVFSDFFIQNTIKKYATGTNILHAASAIEYLAIPFNEQIYADFQKQITPLFERMKKSKLESASLKALRDFLLPLLMSTQARVE